MPYETRWEFIRPHVVDKRIVDIGPAELVGSINRYKLEHWIHGYIADVSKHVVGLEINSDQVHILRGMGYNIIFGNAESFALKSEFDVVMAGEVIEHLSNPGRFVECARDHLIKGGKLLITTPNRYSVVTFGSVIKSGNVPAYRKKIAKHVAYYDSDALSSLLERHGFRNVEVDYCKWVGKASLRMRERLTLEFAFRYRPVVMPVLVAIAEK